MSQRKITSVMLAMAGSMALPAASMAAEDPRLSSHLYNPDEIVRIEGRLNVQATIAFGDGEKIENVAVGDSDSWQIAPNKRADLLFIKPLSEAAHTNMTVVTDRHTYFFDLVASPKSNPIYSLRFTYAEPVPQPAPAAVAIPVPAPVPVATPAPLPQELPAIAGSVVPAGQAAVQPTAEQRRAEQKRLDDQRKAERDAARARAVAEDKRQADARAVVARQRKEAHDAERAAARLAPASGPSVEAQTVAGELPAVGETAVDAKPTAAERRAAKLRTDSAASAAPKPVPAVVAAAPAWKRTGPREILPRSISDDGRSTYAVWPAGQPLPQMLVTDAQGREVPLAFSVDGEKIVIPGVPARIILRANGKAGALEAPQSAAAPTGPTGQ